MIFLKQSLHPLSMHRTLFCVSLTAYINIGRGLCRVTHNNLSICSYNSCLWLYDFILSCHTWSFLFPTTASYLPLTYCIWNIVDHSLRQQIHVEINYTKATQLLYFNTILKYLCFSLFLFYALLCFDSTVFQRKSSFYQHVDIPRHQIPTLRVTFGHH